MALRSLVLACAVAGANAEAVSLNADNWDTLVKNSGKSAFIKFLAPW
jgi:hypothetical protein